MYKAIAVCGCGMGTSLVLRMSAEKAIKELNMENIFEVEHMDLGSAKSMSCDFYIITDDMKDAFNNEGRRYISVKTAFDSNAQKQELLNILDQFRSEREDHNS